MQQHKRTRLANREQAILTKFRRIEDRVISLPENNHDLEYMPVQKRDKNTRIVENKEAEWKIKNTLQNRNRKIAPIFTRMKALRTSTTPICTIGTTQLED